MNTIKKGICLVLALLLCMGLFAACGGGENGEPPDENDPALSGELLAGIDRAEVILEIEGRPVLWEEVFYDIQNLRHMLEWDGPLEDWDAVFEGQMMHEGATYNEFAILYAIDAARERRAVEILFTEDLGGSIEEGFYEEVRAELLAGNDMDEEDFYAFLAENFLTEAVFRYIHETMTMRDRLEELAYGEGGEDIPQSEVDAFVEAEGVLRAKHILLSTRGEDQQPLPEEDQAEIAARAAELYEELAALSGDAQLARFDELMDEYGEDPGMLANPDGYTFMPGVMASEFTEGTQALEMGEISQPIRSDFGYHIILRLPVERDAPVMVPGQQQSLPIPLEIARTRIEDMLTERREELEVVRLPILETIIPSEIFALANAERAEEASDEPVE